GNGACRSARSFALEFAVPAGSGRQPDFETNPGIGARHGDGGDAAEGQGDFGSADSCPFGPIISALNHGVGRDGAAQQSSATCAVTVPRAGGMAAAGSEQRQKCAKHPKACERPHPRLPTLARLSIAARSASSTGRTSPFCAKRK